MAHKEPSLLDKIDNIMSDFADEARQAVYHVERFNGEGRASEASNMIAVARNDAARNLKLLLAKNV